MTYDMTPVMAKNKIIQGVTCQESIPMSSNWIKMLIVSLTVKEHNGSLLMNIGINERLKINCTGYNACKQVRNVRVW